ncbi:MAG: hypothetical protein JOS17DRAFT_478504 [Linnemannia elongata]|nr:MAG: hypothetical protein JOS17DRAFT_478504 [Linnemannia elongata]
MLQLFTSHLYHDVCLEMQWEGRKKSYLNEILVFSHNGPPHHHVYVIEWLALGCEGPGNVFPAVHANRREKGRKYFFVRGSVTENDAFHMQNQQPRKEKEDTLIEKRRGANYFGPELADCWLRGKERDPGQAYPIPASALLYRPFFSSCSLLLSPFLFSQLSNSHSPLHFRTQKYILSDSHHSLLTPATLSLIPQTLPPI